MQLLRGQYQELKRSGSEFEWRDGSGKVTIRGNEWYHQYEKVGGDAISFVRRFYDKTFPEAMDFLLGENRVVIAVSRSEKEKKEKPPFVLPHKNDNMRRVYAYLVNTRKIDREVLYAFVHAGMIYESADYHNAVFVGFDKDMKPIHAHKRGTTLGSSFKGNVAGGIPEYSFHWHGTGEKLYLFEAPINMLSYITMHKDGWRSQSYAACCGVADMVLFQMLKENPYIKMVYLCLDHDEAGLKAIKRISGKLEEQGIPYEVQLPVQKDWNKDLTELEEGLCCEQTM